LADPELWQRYPQLYRVTVKDITAGNRNITALMLRWHDDTYPWLDISVDLVPAIYMPGWQPVWCKPHPLLKHLGCHLVAKWKPDAPSSLSLMELGFCLCDAQIFRDMPQGMKEGYRLAKVMRDKAVCPQIEEWLEVHAGNFITSYILKQCIFKEYFSLCEAGLYPKEKLPHIQGAQNKCGLPAVRSGTSTAPHVTCAKSPQDDVFWARIIYQRVEEAFEKQYLESYFIPGYNLLSDDKYAQYRETAISYARLCRRMLTPQVAQCLRKVHM
jgi:hypothetical protein